MSRIAEDIRNLPPEEKAELYYLLQDDEELKEYVSSHHDLFEELSRRDQDFEEGKIKLTNRQDLSLRLNSLRDVL